MPSYKFLFTDRDYGPHAGFNNELAAFRASTCWAGQPAVGRHVAGADGVADVGGGCERGAGVGGNTVKVNKLRGVMQHEGSFSDCRVFQGPPWEG